MTPASPPAVAERVLLVSMPFGALERPALSLGLLQAHCRDVGVACETRYLTFAFAERVEGGEDMRRQTAKLKLYASEAAGRIADRAMQLHGGFGYTVEGQIERGYRDIRVMRIAEGASEVLRATIARQAVTAAIRERGSTL